MTEEQLNDNTELPTPIPVETPTQYEVMAVVVLSAFGVVGVVLLFALRIENAIALSAIILGFLAPTIVALLSLKQTKHNHASVQALAISVDGRLTQLLKTTKLAARAEGINIGLSGEERSSVGNMSDRKVTTNDTTK